MTTDTRELLELAAKAFGIEGEYVKNYGGGDYYYTGNQDGILYELPQGGWYAWNPLVDDGDALRLAVKLRMSIKITEEGRVTRNCCIANDEFELPLHNDDDFGVATRRAIVRAAAEIGRRMP